MDDLVIGWKVSPGYEPLYWLKHGVKPGNQSSEDVIVVEPKQIAAHAIVIAQSGSGKSFFIGRLIEEILTKTKSKCVVLDSNGDFTKIDKVKFDLWEKAEYDIKKSEGELPTESSRDEFARIWSQIYKSVKSAGVTTNKAYEIWLPDVQLSLIHSDGESELFAELEHCHRIACSLFNLCAIKNKTNSLYTTKRILEVIIKIQEKSGPIVDQIEDILLHEIGIEPKKEGPDILENVGSIQRSVLFVTKKSIRYYLARLTTLLNNGLVLCDKPNNYDENERVSVIDLPSWNDYSIRNIVINSYLSREWNQARKRWQEAMNETHDSDKRVPIFIVIDEAHQYLPKITDNTSLKAIRDQIETIAAEGRKLGLFLIIISQHPDKLCASVTNEFENIAVLKLNSIDTVERTMVALGIGREHEKQMKRCLDFPRGRFLLLGKWKSEGEIGYCAARRTTEGGRNLRSEYWATLPL
ncbi:DUF87 domain-containing protein [bacterium]|nr:DUF87 domain-containing protein [bacterium]MBU1638596.1 DUF87 domain-containing protein [bacterium]